MRSGRRMGDSDRRRNMPHDRRNQGIRIVSNKRRDFNTPQTPGVTRAVAINRAMAGANNCWPARRTGKHYLYRQRQSAHALGRKARFCRRGGSGDFIFVPPFVPHQEFNANENEELACVVVRRDQEPVIVNLDKPESRIHGKCTGSMPVIRSSMLESSLRLKLIRSERIEPVRRLNLPRTTK